MGKHGVSYVKRLYEAFEPEMKYNGIGTISEIFDGDPPHYGVGAISQAWSVAELLRMEYMIRHYSKANKPAERIAK
jgi:glycogen debranching enzyme